MRNMKIRVAVGTLVAVAALIALPATFPGGTLPKVHAQEDTPQPCSVATLNGRYGLTFSGFDGNGNLSAVETVSLGGLIHPVNLPGTYTVNSDCTGTLTTANAHLNLVIVRNGREILAVNTDPGRVAVDNFVKE